MSSKREFTLRVSMMCFGIALGALVLLSLVGVARTVSAQNPASEKVIYNFAPATGQYPAGGVISNPAGNLYVATQAGGSDQSCDGGCGNILELVPPGKATQLYAFPPGLGNAKAAPGPVGSLTRDAQGNLYGATAFGGRYSFGSVFKLTASGVEGILYSFDPAKGDGYEPNSGVTIDSEGNLYGTTYFGGGTTGCGGPGCGIVYKLSPSGGETILHSFTGNADGGSPVGSPILDAAGNLYGTAALGGDLNCPLGGGEGCGTVWKLDTSGNFTVLYSFTGGTDGAFPETALVIDPSGNLYGAAGVGGILSCPTDSGRGCGTVFEIGSSGNFSVLYAFAGGSSDGAIPSAALLRDSAGNLYGTTDAGGNQSCEVGCGVVFKLTSSGSETILHFFAGGTTDGEYPRSALITDGKSNLYGTTSYGGTANGGVVFQVQTQ
jgi:uncharacterized repeat protein (TIGR03803 family)